MKAFNVLKIPIIKDKIMIEASAGTGKTYSIGLLTLRLIIEYDYKINEIVLVTFTNAAAFELKSRTLEVIKDAKDYYEGINNDIDSNIKKIIDNNKTKIENKLEEAINNMNQAMIFTIHGFCSYLLKRHPYTFNVNLDSNLIEDDSEIVEKLIHDYYEKKLNLLPLEVIKKISSLKTISNKKEIISQVRELSTKPYAIYKGYQAGSCLVEEFEKRSQLLSQALKGKEKELIIDFKKFIPISNTDIDEKTLISFSHNQQTLFPYEKLKISLISSLYEAKEDYRKYEQLKDDGFTNTILTIDYNKDGKTISVGQSGVFNDSDKLALFIEKYKDIFNAVEQYFNLFDISAFFMFEYIIKRFKEEKNKLEVKTNDDLIMDVYNCLNQIDIKEFSYLKAIMVDEFQDTDKIQYEIFNKLFHKKPFLMIGDPKQSMYRFRGGDINAYNDVKSQTKTIYSMDTNYRSQDNTISKVNQYYELGNGFSSSNIDYLPIKTGKRNLTIPSDNLNALFYWEYDGENISALQYRGNNDIIKEVYRLKEKVTIEGKEINNSDIAILTSSHKDAKNIYKALQKSGLPAVLLKTQNIFNSNEYKFIHILIDAILNYNNEKAINALLTSKFMDSKFNFDNLTAEKLVSDKNKVVESLYECYESYYQIGMLKALNNFIDKFNIIGRLSIDQEEGRRSISNFKLLLNIIGDYELTNNDFSGLLIHFNYLKENKSEAFEERLESDEDAINILTYHASKGLEWPFVFVYNINALKLEQSPLVKYYDKGDLYYSLNKKDFDFEKKELLAEREKIFYVVMTRAKYRTYFLHSVKGKSNYFKDAVNIEIINNISETRKTNYNYQKPLEKTKEITIKNFTKKDKLFLTNRFSSYSALANKINVSLKYEKEYSDFSFPSSAHVGTIIHQILEEIDFNNPVINKIASYFENISNITPEHLNWLESKIATLFNKKIIEDKYSLKDIKPNDYINELEFLLSSRKLDINNLSSFLTKYGISHNIVDTASLKGYLKGFIDVVFYIDNKYYIIDWKSNYIGPEEDSYHQNNLALEMEKNLYYLQYLIYTVALVRFLKNIKKDFNYERDFGGVYYIFIRGINEENNNGIHFDKPNETLIKKLDKIIGDNSDE